MKTTNYFYIKIRKYRKTTYRVYKTDVKGCWFLQDFPTEEAAKEEVKQLKAERKRI